MTGNQASAARTFLDARAKQPAHWECLLPRLLRPANGLCGAGCQSGLSGRRKLIQSLNVRPVLDGEGEETGTFEVPAGGRRYLALGILIKQKRLAKDEPIPCIVNRGQETSAEEDSLAENLRRADLHPLDQFRAFKTLSDQGLDPEEIGARFFVSPATVKQRLRLALVSPKLLDLYENDEIRLEQIMALSISDDHARQEQVWERIASSHTQKPYYIRRLLTETTVRADDRRAVYVGADAYEAAGGVILRDLFEQDSGGLRVFWSTDPLTSCDCPIWPLADCRDCWRWVTPCEAWEVNRIPPIDDSACGPRLRRSSGRHLARQWHS